MDAKKILKDKKILIVDDEKDILDHLADILDMCVIDTATTYEDAKELLDTRSYHVAILDIMGVRGYDLLELSTKKDIPTLMLTAHAISQESLKKSFKLGASFYVPKDEIDKIDVFLADILDAREKRKNVILRWYERLSGFCERRFGPNWKDDDPEFWNSLLKY